MLFNSYFYLLVFLPIALLGYHLLSRAPFRLALGWLVLISLYFYGIWNPDPNHPWSPQYLLLIIGSCVFNYYLGRRLSRLKHSRPGKLLLTAGVTANLVLLGYFKYAGFLAGIATDLTGWPGPIEPIILPLAISFFTFLQIAYLVDAWKGKTEEYHFTDYLLFVTFFPHLIAGPLIHHREMMPQFERNKDRGLRSKDLSVGFTMLAMGLFKKVVLADYLARTASPIFALAAAEGRDPTMAEAWAGATAYTLQLYFDFSGYSDMALGSARLFGIRFPLNFHSPYKAVSVVDFWRRWHMTLSRFLRDYLYIPLGGNRKGPKRRYVNLFTTMLLGGIWHGAGFTFIIWGALHGLYLCLNHLWFGLRKKLSLPAMPKPLAIGLTFLAVMIGWVFFKAHDVASANRMLASMAGLNGFDGWPPDAVVVVKMKRALVPIAIGLFVVWALPNTQQVMRRYLPALGLREFADLKPGPRERWKWKPFLRILTACGLLLCVGGVLEVVRSLLPYEFFMHARATIGAVIGVLFLRIICRVSKLPWRPTWQWLLFTLVVLYAVGRDFDQLSEFIYFQF